MANPPAPAVPGALRSNGRFLRILSAGIASSAGASIAGICLLWLVYEETGSAIAVAALAIAQTVASVVISLPAGTWADRYNRRRMMIGTDLIRAGAMGAVGLAFLAETFQLSEAIVVTAVVAGATIPFNTAEQVFLPAIVGGDRIADANGLVRSTRSTVAFLGSAVAGILIVALGAPVGLLLNAGTYLVSALLVASVAGPAPAAPSAGTVGKRPDFLSETLQGIRWLRQARGFLWLTASALFLNFFFSMAVPFFVVLVAVELHASALVFGALAGSLALGDVVGALSVGRLGSAAYAGKAWLVGYGGVTGAALLGLVLFPVAWLAPLLGFVAGWGLGFAGTAWLSSAQLLVPTEIQGRYFGIDALGSNAMTPVGALVGALLIATEGVRITFLVAGLGCLATLLVFAGFRELWTLGVRSGSPVGSRSSSGQSTVALR
jgi:hypothetical protein